jgi:GNAT superfamily N-acetyltransferase
LEVVLLSLNFKVAGTAAEREQIHQLNYQAFVEEIPQHPPNPERRLVDRFDAENTYMIGLAGEQVAAMCALRDQRPFSLDQKVANLDQYLPPHQKLGEIRLLYISPPYRNAATFRALLNSAASYAIPLGWDLAVISGTTRQLRLYRHLGFVAFGPLVGEPGAQFQPMYWTLDAFRQHLHWLQVWRPPNHTRAAPPSTPPRLEDHTAGGVGSPPM